MSDTPIGIISQRSVFLRLHGKTMKDLREVDGVLGFYTIAPDIENDGQHEIVHEGIFEPLPIELQN